jgi:hypothetical protein
MLAEGSATVEGGQSGTLAGRARYP